METSTRGPSAGGGAGAPPSQGPLPIPQQNAIIPILWIKPLRAQKSQAIAQGSSSRGNPPLPVFTFSSDSPPARTQDPSASPVSSHSDTSTIPQPRHGVRAPRGGHAEPLGSRVPTQGSRHPDSHRNNPQTPTCAQSLRVPASLDPQTDASTHHGPAAAAPCGGLRPGHCCWPVAPGLAVPGPASPPSENMGTGRSSYPPSRNYGGQGLLWGARTKGRVGLTVHVWPACCRAWSAAPSAACTALRMLP